MARYLLPLLLLAPAAVAQVPYSYPSPYGPIAGPQSFAPNYFNRGTQPVNPYLNLLNSTNPALSYYYGVRPGTMGPNNLGPTFGSGAPLAPPVGRGLFLPPPVAADRDQTFDLTPRTSLPSPGGAVTYGNFFGSSRVGVNNSPRTGFTGGGGGAAGGSTIPPARTGTGSGGPSIPRIR
jgi:hypothetical protein